MIGSSHIVVSVGARERMASETIPWNETWLCRLLDRFWCVRRKFSQPNRSQLMISVRAYNMQHQFIHLQEYNQHFCLDFIRSALRRISKFTSIVDIFQFQAIFLSIKSIICSRWIVIANKSLLSNTFVCLNFCLLIVDMSKFQSQYNSQDGLR